MNREFLKKYEKDPGIVAGMSPKQIEAALEDEYNENPLRDDIKKGAYTEKMANKIRTLTPEVVAKMSIGELEKYLEG